LKRKEKERKERPLHHRTLLTEREKRERLAGKGEYGWSWEGESSSSPDKRKILPG